jgi:transcriptional regulator with XRE-family HTH domain
MSNIGQRIATLRVVKGFKSQNALAKAAGISQGRLSEIEGGVSKPGLDLLSKIARALSVDLATLTADDSPADAGPADSLNWFWRARFGTLKPGEILELQEFEARPRAVWCLQQLVTAFSASAIAARLQTTEEHITALLSGSDVSPWLLTQLNERAQVPVQFLLRGDPGPTDENLRRLLEHSEAGAYLAVIVRAIDNRLLPELLERQMDVLLGVRNSNSKPPVD